MTDESRIEERKRREEVDDDSEVWSYVAVVGILGIVAVVLYFLVFAGGTGTRAEGWEDVRAVEADDPTMVAANASDREAEDMLTVYYVGDFACPHCKEFEERVLPRLKNDYIATGDVRFVFMPVDYIGNADSRNAALAALAVWNRNRSRYWRWHRLMFSKQSRTPGWASPSDIQRYADSVGLDGRRIREAVESGEYAREVRRHRRRARRMGATATPNLVVNGTVVNGNDYERLRKVIESELSELGPRWCGHTRRSGAITRAPATVPTASSR